MRGQREEREREGDRDELGGREREIKGGRGERGGELRKNPLQKSRRRREHRGLCSPLR